LNWRWWPVVIVVAFVLEHLLSKFFDGNPHGSTRAQVWAVVLKIAAVYLIAVIGWLVLLIWSSVLLGDAASNESDGEEEELVPVLVGGPDATKKSSEKLALPL
jgi:hypothetical protein